MLRESRKHLNAGGMRSSRNFAGVGGLADPTDFRDIDFAKMATQALLKGRVREDFGREERERERKSIQAQMEEEAAKNARWSAASRVSRLSVETPSSSNIARSSSPDLRAGVRRIGQSAADAAKRLMGSGQRPRTGGDTVKIEEDLNMDTLLQLKMAFDKADRDRGGGLDIEEFKQAFLDCIPGGDEEERAEAIERLFMKIDANSDGSITWDEFSTYMMLENQGSAKLRETELSLEFVQVDTPQVAPEADVHKDSIMAIAKIPSQIGLHDKYATVSKDGTLKIWSAKDFSILKTIELKQARSGLWDQDQSDPHMNAEEGSAWIVDIKLTPHSNKLVTGSFKRLLKLYETQNFEMCGSQDMEHAPMSIDVFYSSKLRKEFIIVGDVGGFVTIYWLEENMYSDEKATGDRFLFTRAGRISLKRGPKGANLSHESKWVSSVIYLEGMHDSLVASVMDGSVYLLEFGANVPIRIKKEYKGHTKGVFCSAWSNHFNFLATGGMDRAVLLWTPYNENPLAALTGHATSVSRLIINDKDAHIISMSTDKNIRVWDIRSHRCLQSVTDTVRYRPEDTLSALYWDAPRRTLLTGNTRLKLWPLRSIISTGASAHSKPVSCCVYNPNFREAVTGDHDGVVCVWDVSTGQMRFRFQGAHGQNKITAMSFDSKLRRLITGSDTGDLRVWNYSSGNLLRICAPRITRAEGGNREVTGIVTSAGSFSGKYIVSAGWDRRITFYEDATSEGPKEIGPLRYLQGHRADILTLAQGPHNMIATGSDDGEIILWSLDSASLKHRLLPPGHGDRKPTERACECIQFMPSRGSSGYVLASIYADRFLRLWNSSAGNLSLEVYTEHRDGETVPALGINEEGNLIVTGDSKGFLKTWDIKRFNPIKVYNREQALDVVAERASWRAHSQAVTSVQVFTRADVCCVMSTSRDCIVSLFTKEGVHIGDFGKDTWSLIEPSTWRSEEPEPAQDLEPGQDPTPEISAWITHATQGERIALVAKEQAASSGGMVLIDDDLVKKRRPRETDQPAHRIFIVEKDRFDREVNFPYTSGRPMSSFAHLLHIQRPASIPDRPQTSDEIMAQERRLARRLRGRMTVPGHTQVHRKRDSAVASVVTAATAAAAKGPINESIVARLPDILERRCAKSAGLLTLGTPGTGLSGVLERMRGDGSGGRAQTTGGLGAGFGSGVGSMRAQTAGGMLQTLNTGGGREVGRTRPHGGKPMGL